MAMETSPSLPAQRGNAEASFEGREHDHPVFVDWCRRRDQDFRDQVSLALFGDTEHDDLGSVLPEIGRLKALDSR